MEFQGLRKELDKVIVSSPGRRVFQASTRQGRMLHTEVRQSKPGRPVLGAQGIDGPLDDLSLSRVLVRVFISGPLPHTVNRVLDVREDLCSRENGPGTYEVFPLFLIIK